MRVVKKFTVDPFTVLGGETVVEEHLRIDISASGTDRTHVSLLAEAAIRYVQEITGRIFVAGTVDVHFKEFPEFIELPFKASAVNSAKYYAETHAGSLTTLDASDFYLHKATSPSILSVKKDVTGPSNVANDIAYPFIFGFTQTAEVDTLSASADQVPRAFIACCLIYLTHLYENRQAVTSGGFKPYVMPLAFESLVKSLKRIY
jgi:uncharacterized phiE125 gp8 family phage protein